jgi:hypothetical protein
VGFFCVSGSVTSVKRKQQEQQLTFLSYLFTQVVKSEFFDIFPQTMLEYKNFINLLWSCHVGGAPGVDPNDWPARPRLGRRPHCDAQAAHVGRRGIAQHCHFFVDAATAARGAAPPEIPAGGSLLNHLQGLPYQVQRALVDCHILAGTGSLYELYKILSERSSFSQQVFKLIKYTKSSKMTLLHGYGIPYGILFL